MKRLTILSTLIISIFFSYSLTFAGDMTGYWIQKDSWGARAGKSEHKLGHGDHWTTMKKADFKLKVTEQSPDSRSFHGKWCSPNKCEDLVGTIMSDGTIHMADEDGHFEGRIIGSNMEICYIEADEDFRVVNCRVMEKSN